MKQDMIVILDLGSHENTVVARAIRALGVYSEIYPHDITVEELKALPNVKGIVINGGPNNVIDGVEIDVNHDIYNAGIPVIAAGHEKALCEVKLPAFTSDEEAAKVAGPGMYRFIMRNVTKGERYDTMIPKPPCGRGQFYNARRLFFVELDRRLP